MNCVSGDVAFTARVAVEVALKMPSGVKELPFLKEQFIQKYKFRLYIVTLEFLGELLLLSYRGNIVRHDCAAESYCFLPSDFFCKYDALKQLVFV